MHTAYMGLQDSKANLNQIQNAAWAFSGIAGPKYQRHTRFHN